MNSSRTTWRTRQRPRKRNSFGFCSASSLSAGGSPSIRSILAAFTLTPGKECSTVASENRIDQLGRLVPACPRDCRHSRFPVAGHCRAVEPVSPRPRALRLYQPVLGQRRRPNRPPTGQNHRLPTSRQSGQESPSRHTSSARSSHPEAPVLHNGERSRKARYCSRATFSAPLMTRVSPLSSFTTARSSPSRESRSWRARLRTAENASMSPPATSWLRSPRRTS